MPILRSNWNNKEHQQASLKPHLSLIMLLSNQEILSPPDLNNKKLMMQSVLQLEYHLGITTSTLNIRHQCITLQDQRTIVASSWISLLTMALRLICLSIPMKSWETQLHYNKLRKDSIQLKTIKSTWRKRTTRQTQIAFQLRRMVPQLWRVTMRNSSRASRGKPWEISLVTELLLKL